MVLRGGGGRGAVVAAVAVRLVAGAAECSLPSSLSSCLRVSDRLPTARAMAFSAAESGAVAATTAKGDLSIGPPKPDPLPASLLRAVDATGCPSECTTQGAWYSTRMRISSRPHRRTEWEPHLSQRAC